MKRFLVCLVVGTLISTNVYCVDPILMSMEGFMQGRLHNEFLDGEYTRDYAMFYGDGIGATVEEAEEAAYEKLKFKFITVCYNRGGLNKEYYEDDEIEKLFDKLLASCGRPIHGTLLVRKHYIYYACYYVQVANLDNDKDLKWIFSNQL